MKKYKPKVGQYYFMINSRFEIKHPMHTGSKKSLERIRAGNCFKTREQAYSFRAMIDDVISGVAVPVRKPWWRFW